MHCRDALPINDHITVCRTTDTLRPPLSVPGSLVLPETFSIDRFNDHITVFSTTDTLRPPLSRSKILPQKTTRIASMSSGSPCPKQDCLHVGPRLQYFTAARRCIPRMRRRASVGCTSTPGTRIRTGPSSSPSSMPTRNSCPTSIQDTLRTTVMCGRRRPRGSARRAPSMEAPNGSWMRAVVGASQPSRSRELAPMRRVDLSAGQIRFCRLWAQYLGSKVSLHWANSEKLPFTSDSFDLVQYTYMHEMPRDTAFRIPTEMYRVMKSDGVLSGLEVFRTSPSPPHGTS